MARAGSFIIINNWELGLKSGEVWDNGNAILIFCMLQTGHDRTRRCLAAREREWGWTIRPEDMSPRIGWSGAREE